MSSDRLTIAIDGWWFDGSMIPIWSCCDLRWRGAAQLRSIVTFYWRLSRGSMAEQDLAPKLSRGVIAGKARKSASPARPIFSRPFKTPRHWSALSSGAFRRLKKPGSRDMSARGYAIHSVCPQFSFLFVSPLMWPHIVEWNIRCFKHAIGWWSLLCCRCW